MLKDRAQTTLDINRNYEIYDKLVPKDNFFRKLDEYVDFSFLYEYLKTIKVKILVDLQRI